jgi:hypothetical protein
VVAVPWAFQERGRSVPMLPLLFQIRSNSLWAGASFEGCCPSPERCRAGAATAAFFVMSGAFLYVPRGQTAPEEHAKAELVDALVGFGIVRMARVNRGDDPGLDRCVAALDSQGPDPDGPEAA